MKPNTFKNNARIYYLKKEYSREDLLGGRKILYVSQKIGYNRDHVSLILRGKFPCSKKTAEDLIKVLLLPGGLDDYFRIMSEKEYEAWKKTLQN